MVINPLIKCFFDQSGHRVFLDVFMRPTSVFFIGCLNQFPQIGEFTPEPWAVDNHYQSGPL